MAEVPYKVSDESESDFYQGVMKIIQDLNDERIGGAYIGDVFHSPSDTLTLKVAENSGLYKNDDGELDINITASCIRNVPSGNIASTDVQAAINELDGQKLSGDGSDNCRVGMVKIYNITGGIAPDYMTYFAPVLYGMGGVGFTASIYNILSVWTGGQWGGANKKEWWK